MAINTFAPSGLREARSISGLSPNYATINGFIAYNYGTAIGFGDLVTLTSGLVTLAAANAATNVLGVFLGCDYFDPANPINPPFHPAWMTPTLPSTTIVTARVCVDPNATFLIQAGNPTGTTVLSAANIGSIFPLVGSAGAGLTTPATYSGLSTNGMSVTAGAGPLRLVSIPGLNDGSFGTSVGGPTYNATIANQWVEVKIVSTEMALT